MEEELFPEVADIIFSDVSFPCFVGVDGSLGGFADMIYGGVGMYRYVITNSAFV